MTRKLHECIGAVAVGGLACVGLGEAAEFSRPSQLVCDERSQVRDFGPREGCTHVPGPHPRSARVAALTVSTSSIATLTSPLFVFDAYHADEAAASADQRPPSFSVIAPSTSPAVNRVSLYMHGPVFIVEPGKWPPRQVR
jgi:hypothetical protein